MPGPPIDVADLPGDWALVDDADVEELTAELAREVPIGHTLHGVVAEPMAVKWHRKDTIWWLADRQVWAFVHLTYSIESDPRWPRCDLYLDWQALVADQDDD